MQILVIKYIDYVYLYENDCQSLLELLITLNLTVSIWRILYWICSFIKIIFNDNNVNPIPMLLIIIFIRECERAAVTIEYTLWPLYNLRAILKRFLYSIH